MSRNPFQSLQSQLLGPLVALLLLFTLLFGYFSLVLHREHAKITQKISLNSQVGRHADEVTRISAQIQRLLFELHTNAPISYEAELARLTAQRTERLAQIRALTKENKRWSSLGVSMAGGIEDASFLQLQVVVAAKNNNLGRSALALSQLSMIFEINSSRLKDFRLHLENDLQSNARELESLLTQTICIFLAITGLLATGLWGIAFLYRVHILTPLQKLHKGLQSLSKGEMNSQIRTESAPRELREMTADFNKMASSLQARQEDLTRARELALSASQAKSDFLANMSHEIRTPLNTIVGITDELTALESTGTRKEYAQILSNSSQVLLNIVNDILDFSKLEDGSISLVRIPVDMNELTERISSVVAPMAHKKGLEFERSFVPNDPCWVLTDPKRIEQIILNLLGNAIKFTDSGKVMIQVSAVKYEENTSISMRVSDTGTGIPQEDLTTIFERFTQSDASITRKHGGTGLGLSIVKQLVLLMHGQITVESQPGKGSEFHVELQFPEAMPIQSPRTQSTHSAAITVSREKKQILLVDDSTDNRALIEIYLKNSPHEITMAENGLEAVGQFELKKFDLILMDLQMPVMDGYEAIKKIRILETDKGLRKTRVIALSAYIMPEEIERGYLAGCDDYLTKPIRKNDLMAAIDQTD